VQSQEVVKMTKKIKEYQGIITQEKETRESLSLQLEQTEADVKQRIGQINAKILRLEGAILGFQDYLDESKPKPKKPKTKKDKKKSGPKESSPKKGEESKK